MFRYLRFSILDHPAFQLLEHKTAHGGVPLAGRFVSFLRYDPLVRSREAGGRSSASKTRTFCFFPFTGNSPTSRVEKVCATRWWVASLRRIWFGSASVWMRDAVLTVSPIGVN